MTPVILHLDMNSYFASVEQQDNPAWRGKPLGVCEHLGGIIIAASIEAKRWGIKTGTPVWEARKLYPKIILTKTRPAAYRFYIKKVVRLVGQYTALVEQTSIDEMFIDLTKACNVEIVSAQYTVLSVQSTDYCNPFAEAVDIAQTIKRRMKLEVADYLTCSIGIAENKLLAKIGSNLQKPNGLAVITSDKLQAASEKYLVLSKNDLYDRLNLTDIPGIGRRQEKNLQALGIKTLLDLKHYPKSLLVARFGINGHHLHHIGQLESSWKPEVDSHDQIKSIGHMYTLPKQYRQPKFFIPVLYKLCEMVAKRLRKQNLSGNIIHFYVRDSNYRGFGKSQKLDCYVYDGREIFLEAMRIYEKLNPPSLELKLIGVTVAGLKPYIPQLSLFGRPDRQRQLLSAVDKINLKYGDFTVCRVPVLGAKAVFHDSIGFGRIKEK